MKKILLSMMAAGLITTGFAGPINGTLSATIPVSIVEHNVVKMLDIFDGNIVIDPSDNGGAATHDLATCAHYSNNSGLKGTLSAEIDSDVLNGKASFTGGGEVDCDSYNSQASYDGASNGNSFMSVEFPDMTDVAHDVTGTITLTASSGQS